MTKVLSAKIDELERLAPTRSDALQISRASGEFLAAVALSVRAMHIVEVGTSYGFSGLWWASALAITGGRLHTIDILETKFRSARETFAAAGVADRIISHLGRGVDVLPTIDGQIDLAFIDADKASSQPYFDLLWPRVRVGGGVLTDNIVSHKNEMQSYVAALRQRPDAHTLTVPIGSGVEWTIKVN